MCPIYFVYSGQRELTSLKRETGAFPLHFCMVPTILVESWSCRSQEWCLLSPFTHHILTLLQFLVGAAWSSSNQVIPFLLSSLILFLSPSLVPWSPVPSHCQLFPHLGFCPFPPLVAWGHQELLAGQPKLPYAAGRAMLFVRSSSPGCPSATPPAQPAKQLLARHPDRSCRWVEKGKCYFFPCIQWKEAL